MIPGVTHWEGHGTGSNAGVTVTKTAATGKTYFVTHISGFSDKDCYVKLTSGSTDIAIWKLDLTLTDGSFNFSGLWPITPGSDMVASITTSTSACFLSVCGFTIP